MGFFKRWFALKRAKKIEQTPLPTGKDIEKEDKEFQKESKKLYKLMTGKVKKKK